jgi:hypothetical protein
MAPSEKKASWSGRSATTTPPRPTAMAAQWRSVTFSCRTGIDNTVMISGATKKMV